MLSTLFFRLVLTFAVFVFGAIAFYQQNLGLYMVFTILTGVLGFAIEERGQVSGARGQHDLTQSGVTDA